MDRDDLFDPASYVRKLRQPRPALAEAMGKKLVKARKRK
jgi:hypothetical protein